MMKHVPISLVLLLLFSCSRTKKTTNSNSEENIYSSLKTKEFTSKKHTNLFNTKLVGLSSKENNFFIDFSSVCMCDAPSILMQEKMLFFFNYCNQSLPPKSKEQFYTYTITKIKEDNISLIVTAINNNNETIVLSFEKHNTHHLYKLTSTGKIPSSYIGNRFCTFFTPYPKEFTKEDCGDFDG